MGNNPSRKAANGDVVGTTESEDNNTKSIQHGEDADNDPSEGSSTGHTSDKNKIKQSKGGNSNDSEWEKLLLRGVKPGSLLEKIILSQPNRSTGLGIVNDFPDELVLHILSFLTVYDLVTLSEVSKQFYMVVSDDLLWKILYLNGMSSLVETESTSTIGNSPQQRYNVLIYYKKKKASNQKGPTSSIRRKQERKVQYMGSWQEVVHLNFCKFDDEFEEDLDTSNSNSSKKNGNSSSSQKNSSEETLLYNKRRCFGMACKDCR